MTKIYWVAAVLMLLINCPESSAVIKRCSTSPKLHSIFDSQPASNNSIFEPNLNSLPSPYRFESMRRGSNPKRKHTIGLAFLGVGAAAIVGGTALFLYGKANVDKQPDFRIYVQPGAYAVLAGLALMVPGLYFTLKYRQNGKYPWTKDS